MDPAALALATFTLLEPSLAIISVKTAEKIGESLPEWPGKVWGKLQARMAKKPAAQEAAQDLLKEPADPDVQASFRKELKKLLQEDSTFASELEQLVGQAQISYRAEQKGGTGNVIVQGAGNTVTVTVPDSKKK